MQRSIGLGITLSVIVVVSAACGDDEILVQHDDDAGASSGVASSSGATSSGGRPADAGNPRDDGGSSSSGGSTCPSSQTLCADGCSNLKTDRANCGECGTVCEAGTVCDGAGECEVSCQTGLLACDGTCVDPLTNRAFCGATAECSGATAGTTCASGEICNGGVCELSCGGGLLACGAACVDPATSRTHCGATGDCLDANAGVACASGETCNGAGACEPSCQAGQITCAGTCVDPTTSRAFCGATDDCAGANAGVACGAGEICNGAGACELSCQTGLLACGGTCVDPATSRTHCGATADCLDANAGVVCADGEICNGAGACEPSCQAGLVACGGTCVDPATSRTFCGASNDCAGANAGVTCAAGQLCNGAGACEVSCQAGLLACNGTCTDPATSMSHCGATANCAGGNAGSVCGDGTACVQGTCRQLGLKTFVGPAVNVPAASLTGWTQCYSDLYSHTGTTLATIQAACPQANLMLACRQVGSQTFSVAAHAPRSDVLFATGNGNVTHAANGSGWYYSDSYSWGFAPAGEAVSRNSCDTQNVASANRLCWHTNGATINGGWRCGGTTDLNFSGGWERVILQAP